MSKLRNILAGMAVLSAVVFSIPSALADGKSAPNPLYEPELEHQRDPNQYCAKCHKFDTVDEQSKGEFHAGKFHGIHLTKNNPNTGKPITCVSCHGNISENHRRGAKDVMRFHGDIFSDEKPMYSAQEQNQVCFACHQPEKLRETLWAHDVHAMKLPCASCHTLHPEKEAMRQVAPKDRVKLCVDCHGEQQRRQLDQLNSEKKDN